MRVNEFLRYRETKGLAPATIRNRRTRLLSLCKWRTVNRGIEHYGTNLGDVARLREPAGGHVGRAARWEFYCGTCGLLYMCGVRTYHAWCRGK